MQMHVFLKNVLLRRGRYTVLERITVILFTSLKFGWKLLDNGLISLTNSAFQIYHDLMILFIILLYLFLFYMREKNSFSHRE